MLGATSRLEQTDRIARITLVVAVVGACVSPFVLGALKELPDQTQAATTAAPGPANGSGQVRAKGALEQRQYLQPALGVEPL